MAEQDPTTDEAPTSAIAKVFAIPELLELILLHTIDGQQRLMSFQCVPHPDLEVIRRSSPERIQQLRALLVNQRVAMTFAAIIASSRILREALFFTHERCDNNGKYKSNPAINELVTTPSVYYNPQPNPAWTNITWAGAGSKVGTVHLRRYIQDYHPLGFTEQSSVGSLRKMLLVSQPMEMAVKTEVFTHCGSTEFEESWDCGTTMGQLMEESDTLLRRTCLENSRCTRNIKR
ncbi:hypothetical protein LTR17_001060 [Elasticomyces elasticus]|nr:hypothetical protein LTR17_001060 [Elasticomyces elasticus]